MFGQQCCASCNHTVNQTAGKIKYPQSIFPPPELSPDVKNFHINHEDENKLLTLAWRMLCDAVSQHTPDLKLRIL
jgi:hypothetical protein